MNELTFAAVALLGALCFGAPAYGRDVVTLAEKSTSPVDTMVATGVQLDSLVAKKMRHRHCYR